MKMLLFVLNIEFLLNYSLMLFSLTSEYCFDMNNKYMHAGMNHCLAAAAVSRRQKSSKCAKINKDCRDQLTKK